jgi:hypothetical protein
MSNMTIKPRAICHLRVANVAIDVINERSGSVAMMSPYAAADDGGCDSVHKCASKRYSLVAIRKSPNSRCI